MSSASEEPSQFDLADLSQLSFSDLSTLNPDVFSHSLKRILEEIDKPQAPVAGWNSAM